MRSEAKDTGKTAKTATKYCFCGVKTIYNNKIYHYISDDGNIEVGDLVEVEFGSKGIISAIVEYVGMHTAKNAPYAVTRTKHIIRKLDHIVKENDLLMNKDKTKVIKYIGKIDNKNHSNRENGFTIVIPEGVEEISDKAFYDIPELEEVILPKTLKKIGQAAFACTSIRKVYIPDSVEEIGEGAFTYVWDESFIRDNAINERDQGLPIFLLYRFINDPIGRGANAELVFDADNKKFRSDGVCAYMENNDGTEDLLSCHKTDIRSYNVAPNTRRICNLAFVGCRKLEYLQLNKELKYIDRDVFSYCVTDRNAMIPHMDTVDNRDKVCNINERRYLEAEPGNSVYLTKNGMLYDRRADGLHLLRCNANYGTVIIPEGTVEIFESAFENCQNLRKVILPMSLQTIGKKAFWGCRKLNTVTTSKNKNFKGGICLPPAVDIIKSGTFVDTGFVNLTISNHVRYLEGGAFYNCQYLKRVVLPANLMGEFGNYKGSDLVSEPFKGCRNLLEYDIDESNKVYSVKNGVLMNKEQTEIVSVPEGYDRQEFVIPPEVKYIGMAFAGCNKIRRLIFPDGWTEIGDYAFEDSQICEYYIPPSCTKIISNVFDRMVQLSAIKVLGVAGSYAQTYVKNYKSEYIKVGFVDSESNEEEVNYAGFDIADDMLIKYTEQPGVTKVVIPDTIKTICEFAFLDCSNITTVVVPDGVKVIDKFTFAGCLALREINIPEGVRLIDEWAFGNCESLTQIKLPGTLEEIGDSAFSGCVNLQSIDIPDSVRKIDVCAFSYCEKLSYVKLPCGLQRLERCVFEHCRRLPDVKLPGNLKRLEDRAFEDCNSLTEIVLPEGIEYVSGFSNCENLLKVVIPVGVKEIGQMAFSQCKSLQSVELPDGLEKIGSSAFDQCSNLTEINLPDSLKEIDYNAFSGAANLTEITLPQNLEMIGDYAFSSCSFASMVIPVGVKNMGKGIFFGADVKTVVLEEGMKNVNIDAFQRDYDDDVIEIFGLGVQKITGNLYSRTIDYEEHLQEAVLIFPKVFPLSIKSKQTQRALAFGYIAHPELYSGNAAELYHKYVIGERQKLLPWIFACDNVAGIKFYAENGQIDSDNFDISYMAPAEQARAVKCIDFLKEWQKDNMKADQPWIYEILADDTIRVKRCNGVDVNVKIPATIDGYRVSVIGDIAYEFAGIFDDFLRKRVQSVVMPMGMKRIEDRAFENCIKLKRAIVPAGVEEIGQSAFSGCTGITNAVIPQSVKVVGSGAFYNCANLRNISIPEGVEEIESSAFQYCSNMKRVSLPQSLIRIADYGFAGCEQVSEITIPEGVKEIGNYAFSKCKNLTKVIIPDSITKIGYCAFEDCPNLIIYASECSYTEQYAKENRLKFEPLG